MTNAVHIYSAPRQPATSWVDPYFPGGSVPFKAKGGHLMWTTCCRRRRPARNLEVQVYYDATRCFCRAGTGCRVPRRRMPAGRILLRDFARGLSVVGLARKYGQTAGRIEVALRRVSRPKGG